MSPQAVDWDVGASEVPEGAGAADDEVKKRPCKDRMKQVNTRIWKRGYEGYIWKE